MAKRDGGFFGGCVVLLLVIALSPAMAHAAESEADRLIREGIAFRKQGDDAAALEKFKQAHALDHSAKALAQVGLAEQALGKWVDAHEHLYEALDAKGEAWIDKNRRALGEAARTVDDHVGTLEILGGPKGASVSIDGAPRGTLPLARPLVVATGLVTIELTAAGYLPLRRATTIQAHEMTREFFENAAPATPVAAPAEIGTVPPAPSSTSLATTPQAGAAADDGSSASRRTPLILGAAGVAAVALALGIVEHVSWQNKVSSFDSMGCGADLQNRGGGGCATLYDDGHRARTLALIGYGVGGALLATAGVLYLSDPARSGRSTQMACTFQPASPGVACLVRF